MFTVLFSTTQHIHSFPSRFSENQVQKCFYNFFKAYLFILEKDSDSVSRERAVREGEREPQVGSALSAQSPTWGSIAQNREIMT